MGFDSQLWPSYSSVQKLGLFFKGDVYDPFSPFWVLFGHQPSAKIGPKGSWQFAPKNDILPLKMTFCRIFALY